jgi:hypothetical protein
LKELIRAAIAALLSLLHALDCEGELVVRDREAV